MKPPAAIVVLIICVCGTLFFCDKHPKDMPQTAAQNDTINDGQKDEANKELLCAVLSNDTVSAKAAIANGADPNYTPEPGKSLFCFAFDSLFVDMAELLVRHGIELKGIKCGNRDMRGEVAYWLAGEAKPHQFVKYLNFKKLWLKYNGLHSWETALEKERVIISTFYDNSRTPRFVWLSLDPPYAKEIFPCDKNCGKDCMAGIDTVYGDTVRINCIVSKDDCIGVEFKYDPEEPGSEKPTDTPGCYYIKSFADYDRMGNRLKIYYPKKRVGWYR
jgi:hypothetical protein